MLYQINRINRNVELDDELVNKYLEYDELHEQIFSIVIRSEYGHAPTVDEVSNEDLSALCNEVLFSELKALALLPKAIMKIYDNYEEYIKKSNDGELVEYQL